MNYTNEALSLETLKPIDQLKPGEIYEISGTSNLAPFEDLVASEIQPNMEILEARGWSDRKALRDLIRPDKYFGTISGITLEAIKDPYQRLFDVNSRGKKYLQTLGVPHLRLDGSTEDYEEQTKGFVLTGNAKSSGKGIIGQIQVEIYYVPPPNRIDLVYSTNVHTNSGGIHRYMTKPEIIKTPNTNAAPNKIGSVALGHGGSKIGLNSVNAYSIRSSRP